MAKKPKTILIVIISLLILGCIVAGTMMGIGAWIVARQITTSETVLVSSPTPEPTQTFAPRDASTETPRPTLDTFDPTTYWTAVQDPHYGVRFALPCFWLVDFPDLYPEDTGISYSVRNYPYEYVENFPRGEGVWESGGIKIDMNFVHVGNWGMSPGIGMEEFVNELYANDSETNLIAADEITVNGQDALLVTTESTFGHGKFYLFQVSDEIFLIASPNQEAIANSTVTGIVHSLALSPEVAMAWPYYLPDEPPIGLTAPCMGIHAPVPDPHAPLPGCFANSMNSADELALALQTLFPVKNIGELVYKHMNDPMMIGYWGSEIVWRSPLELGSEFANDLLPEDTSRLTFTSDQRQFPVLEGINIDGMFGPDVIVSQIIYSQGWGPDSQGGALLYIAEDTCGKLYWHGLVYSAMNFER